VWYHLPLAEAIAEGRHRAIPDLWWTMIPLAYHVLAALAYGLGGGMAAKLLHPVFLLLAGALAYRLGSRLHGAPAGLAAAILFLAIPVVMWDGTAGNADLGAVVFGVAGVFCVVEFVAHGVSGWLFLAGALVGTATGVKSFAATLLVPIVAVLFVEPSGPGRRRGVLLLVAGASVTAGPWLWRAAVLTGNPVFPAFEESAYAEGLRGGGAWTGAYPWTPGRVLAFPFALTFRASELAEMPDAAMGGYPLLWLPLLVAGFSALGRLGRYILAIAVGHLAAIVAFAPSPRFLLTAWLLLAVVVGGLVAGRGGDPAWIRGRAGCLLAAVLSGGLAASLVAWLGFFPVWPSVDYLTGRIDRHGFLQRTVPALDTFERVRALVPPEEKILVDGLYATWHARRHLLPSFLPSVRPLFRQADLSRAEALDLLRQRQTRYFLAPAAGRYRLLELGLATPLLSHEGFTLYALDTAGP
jgi:hypothetical protein